MEEENILKEVKQYVLLNRDVILFSCIVNLKYYFPIRTNRVQLTLKYITSTNTYIFPYFFTLICNVLK